MTVVIFDGHLMELFSEDLRKDHLLSKVDARIKLMVALALLVMVLSHQGMFFPLFITCFCLLLCLGMKVPLRTIGIRFSEPLFVAAVLVLLKLFFSGTSMLFSVNLLGVKIIGYQEGLVEGLRIGSRIVGAVSILAVMGFSTPFVEFLASLAWFRVPRDLIEILLFAYRYLFVLLDEGTVIYHAQKTRLGYSSLKRSFNSFGILTGSLILKTFEHSQNTVVAMIQRGYDGHIPILTHRSLKKSQILGLILLIILMGFLWMI